MSKYPEEIHKKRYKLGVPVPFSLVHFIQMDAARVWVVIVPRL